MARHAGHCWMPQWPVFKILVVAVLFSWEVAALSFGDRHPPVAKQSDAKRAASRHLQQNHASPNTLLGTRLQKVRGGGGAHHSIFELDVSYVDNVKFWYVLGGMLAFTIFVDRLQDYCEHWAHESAGKLMLWRRVSSELMMFGIVAISIFVATNCWSNIPGEIYLLVEFIDIFLSCGCCGLIGMCAILLLTTKLFAWQIKDFGRSSKRRGSDAGTRHHVSATRIGNTEYKEMKRVFFEMHPMPDNFDYNEYVSMILMRNCCNIMSIHWTTWALLVVVSCLGALARLMRREGVMDTDTYLLECIILNWVTCLMHVFVMLNVYRCQHVFLLHLRDFLQHPPEEGQNSQKKGVANPFGEHWADRIKWLAQICAVVNAFLSTLFLMHELYNLTGHAFLWYAALLLPLFFNFFIALPFIVSHIAFIEAFYVMDSDGMDIMLEELDELETDLRSLRNRWQKAGSKKPTYEGEITLEGLSIILKELGIHCSETRCRRIFKALDQDDQGDLTMEEFMHRILDYSKDYSKEPSGSSTPVASHADTPRRGDAGDTSGAAQPSNLPVVEKMVPGQ